MRKFPPVLSFLPSHVIVGLCTCGPVGKWGRAPGTNGSLLGLALYTLLFFPLSLAAEFFLLAILILLAIPICEEGERRLGKRDPGEIILDEVVAIPLCFFALKDLMAQTGYVWLYMLAGFLFFRLFDILKPFGIKKLQKYPGGVGVVIDDLAAALATNLVLRLLALAWLHYGNH